MAKQKAYAAAGVDIDAANRTKKRIAGLVRATFGPEVLSDIGEFGGLFVRLPGATTTTRCSWPVPTAWAQS